VSKISSRQRSECGTHRAIVPMGNAVTFVGAKLNTHLHSVPSSRILELYLHSPHTSLWRDF
jgi:hypothetical protein